MFSHRIRLMIAATLITTACASEERPDSPPHADNESTDVVIYTGGTIYTGVDDTPTAEAVAVANGVILAVGSRDMAARLFGDNQRGIGVFYRLIALFGAIAVLTLGVVLLYGALTAPTRAFV